MVGAIVEHLGEPAPVPRRAVRSAAPPAPAVMAEAGEDFYRGVAKAGYRGAYLISLARSVASGDLDLEALGRPGELPDEEVEPGSSLSPGSAIRRVARDDDARPVPAAHPRLLDAPHVRQADGTAGHGRADRTAVPAVRAVAGLAFWLTLTRSWVPDEASPSEAYWGSEPMVRARSRGSPGAPPGSALRPAPARRRSRTGRGPAA